MATGIPAVVTKVGGNVELVEDGVSGFTVSPRDPSALAEKLSMLIRDSATRRQFGNAARRRAEQLFDLENMTTHYIDLYQSECTECYE